MTADDGEPPAGTDPRDAIVRLEAELDDLGFALERCRKSMLVARALMLGGAVLLAFAILRRDGTALVTGIAAALGGIVLGGSTRTTRVLLTARMVSLEEQRIALIDELAPLATHPTSRSPAPSPREG